MSEIVKINDEIDIKKLFLVFWKSKILIIFLTSIFAVSSVFISLSLPNIYTSKAVLLPANDKNSINGQLGAYSSLAGIAGINLPNTLSDSYQKSIEAIERIKSYKFFVNEFLPFINLHDLLAVEKWSEPTGIIYDDNIYEVNSNKWVRPSNNKKSSKPSPQEAYEVYKYILEISENNLPFVTVTINHQSPNIAKDWLDLIITNINSHMRELDKIKAISSIDFLEQSAEKTSLYTTKNTISGLLESQMQILMFAEATEEYVFKIIESPIAPEIKSKPSRALICILITGFGFLISLFIALINNFYRIGDRIEVFRDRN